MLLSDPVVVDIGDESFTLAPLDITKDVPNTWKSVQQAMDLMGSSREDWRNLPKLLGAIRRAGRKWKDWQWERIVRRVGDAGMVEEVVECVRQTEATGLVLGDLRLVREVMWACREKAIIGGWAQGDIEKALKCAMQISEALEEDVHSRKFTKATDPRMQSDILAIVVELAAVRAIKFQKGEDRDGKVEMYTKRLVPNMPELKGQDLLGDAGEGLMAARVDYELLRWLPVREALKRAAQVLGDKMLQADVMKSKVEELDRLCKDGPELVEAADEANTSRRKGLRWVREAEERNA